MLEIGQYISKIQALRQWFDLATQQEFLFLLYKVNTNNDRADMVKILGFSLRHPHCSHFHTKRRSIQERLPGAKFSEKKKTGAEAPVFRILF